MSYNKHVKMTHEEEEKYKPYYKGLINDIERDISICVEFKEKKQISPLVK